MTTDELRQRFLDFFSSREHKIYPSDSLIPKDDPTLLFTSAGMNQFKQEFLARPTTLKRCASAQRCLRTDDLDKVGKTSFHHTFFEMLGNFSFGDYFKEKAIDLAWEFVTCELKLSPEKLWISVYIEDAESYKIWKDRIGVAHERIVKLGAKENFWPANAPEEGPDGPCGPCSEIFYDQGKLTGCGRAECSPACSCGRFVETWNLVFTQFERKGKDILESLPHKNIDTGMGLERMAAVLQGVTNNFEIDIFQPITHEIMHSSGLAPSALTQAQYSARNAIADHIRAITFAIADGILPSNDARGYVVRKLIRRALWHGKNLGIRKPYLYKIVPVVLGVMKTAYSQFVQKREEIARIVLAEERRFQHTLKRAVSLCHEMIVDLKEQGKSKVTGDMAFKLYDTYGLPQEMLTELVNSYGFELDKQGFRRELELQRQISRQASSISGSVFVDTLASRFKLKATKFVGDKVYTAKTMICALFKDDHSIKKAKAGEAIKIVLETTPFYGEAGGQIGDTGEIRGKNLKVKISDTQRIDRTIIHLGKIMEGIIKVNDKVEARIDVERRTSIAANHTATHLLQSALRRVLGEHVRQSGSWVGPDRLRFDFTHFKGLTKREISRVEELVNTEIKKNKELDILHIDYEQSQKIGALAFFAEKYQEKVRAVKIGDISLELCGGTHVHSAGEIEMFKIVNETAVASGIRRIEAVTAKEAQKVLSEEENQLQRLKQIFGVQEKLPEHIEGCLSKIKELNKRMDRFRIESFKSRVDKIVASAPCVADIKIITYQIRSVDMKLLRLLADLLRQREKPSVVLVASVQDEDKVLLVCALTPELKSRGLDATKIIRTAAGDVGGTGGGRADFAQAGGENPQRLKQAFSHVETMVKSELKEYEPR